MKKLSAGLLLHRRSPSTNQVEVLLVHPGGPFWEKKDNRSWSLPKGEYQPEDDAFETALREFREELGSAPPQAPVTPLGELRQPSGKVITAWAVETDFDADTVTSNTFEMEWPKGSGQTRTFPEVDRAAWLTVSTARQKILKGQEPFIDKLLVHLLAVGKVEPSEVEEPEQGTLL